ncbi:MAG: GNAT family N-acetyltransferase [Candidatus Eisenbacteria bacterium]|nr:GNAT family N-acetyltransferase [Candidatus Eisenbacteria bacterium]
MLKSRVHESVADLDPRRWDALGSDPFGSHATLAALEVAGLPGVRMRYVTLEDGAGRWLAAAPVARVEVDAGRLTHGLFHSLVTGVRRVRPGFLYTALMVCGAPLSVGNEPVRTAAGADLAGVLGALAGVLVELAHEAHAPWAAFKEFRTAEPAGAALKPRGWIMAPGETNFVLDLRWSAYSGYLAGLRSDYRYKVRRSERAMCAAEVTVDLVPLAEGYTEGVHPLYEAVVDRAEVRLERLTARFFQEFGRSHGAAAQLLRFRRDGRVVGWVALLFDGPVVYDMFHGIDYAVNAECDLYFNQLAWVVRTAIESGSAVLSMGQSTAMAKTRFGARPDPRWTAVRNASGPANTLLRAGQAALFPTAAVPRRRVFAEEPCVTS